MTGVVVARLLGVVVAGLVGMVGARLPVLVGAWFTGVVVEVLPGQGVVSWLTGMTTNFTFSASCAWALPAHLPPPTSIPSQ